jgi:hypothetical protein
MMGTRRILVSVKKNKRRRCLSCQELFYPHPRTRTQQKYCSKPQCRQASKEASQQRWLQKPENRDYFRGPQHVDRVRAWRKTRLDQEQNGPRSGRPLQETITGQRVDHGGKSFALALQETIELQPLERVAESELRIAGTLQDSI